MIVGGKVIHQLGRSDFSGSLPALMNNFGNGIRAGVRGKAPSLHPERAIR
jgi:hypothetical protein